MSFEEWMGEMLGFQTRGDLFSYLLKEVSPDIRTREKLYHWLKLAYCAGANQAVFKDTEGQEGF